VPEQKERRRYRAAVTTTAAATLLVALADGRTVLFVDESGFYLLPMVARTYAPIGETPVLRHPLTHDHLSVIGAVGLHARLYFQV
jgi:hypothetical protein